MKTFALPMPNIPGLSPEVWAQSSVEIQAIVIALETNVRELKESNVKLEQRLQNLEERGKQDSSNSSKPPSSDPWWKKNYPNKEKSGKKPGGQSGHRGKHRPVIALEKVDEVVQHFPEECGDCGQELSAEDNLDEEPERRQVAELPVVKILITEHQLHRRTCKSCGSISKAKPPPGVAQSAFGPHLQAEIVHLIGNCKLSRRGLQQYAAESWGLDLSLGSIHAIEQKASAALQAPYDEALSAAKQASVRYIDETSWPQNNKAAWLWTVVCAAATVFMIAPTRKSAEIQALLGDALRFGIIITDRYKGYNFLEMIRRGICHAHLKRDFAKIALLGGPESTLGHALGSLHRQLFVLWRRLKSGEIEREVFDAGLAPIQRSMKSLLEEGSRSSHKKIAGMCADILRHWEAMWTFTRVEGVDPTNNAAERAHRPAVKWRGMSFGTRSSGGSRFVERMLTVAETCRQNRRNVLEYLTQAIVASASGQPAPRLISASPEA